jgi:hypothetical protein
VGFRQQNYAHWAARSIGNAGHATDAALPNHQQSTGKLAMANRREAQKALQDKVTYDLLRQKYTYDPETGHWYYRERADFHDCYKGYRVLLMYVDGKRCQVKAHRAAFLYMNGKWPELDVDHRDLDKSNNAWTNLRQATHAENLSNMAMSQRNRSGYRGVAYRKDMNKYAAYVTWNKKRIHLGMYNTPEEANWVAQDHALHLKKEFYRHR